VSFLTKIRKTIHTTPVLREVSQGYANAFGAGKAYAEFDAKIGIAADGAPVPSQDQYQGFGRDDLAALAAERYPGTAALVQGYRENEGRFRPIRTAKPVREAPQELGLEEDFSEDLGDYYDEEQE